MGRRKSPPSWRETTISWAIMGVLAVIAVGVFIKQSHYNPSLFIPSVPESQAPGESALESLLRSGFSDLVPADMGAVSPVESFGPETLFEKIDGKAELYLSAGFLNLRCQRFARHADPQSWMEVCVYDMGTLQHAFAVYSAQRRAEGEPLGLTAFSDKTKNALFWVHGRYYVEIIASAPSEAMMESMRSFGKNFVRKTPVQGEKMRELALFPRGHLEERSTALIVSDAFGFDGLDNVFTASYHVDSEEMIAFLSQQHSPDEAERLAKAYRAFLLEHSGTDVPITDSFAGAALIQIFDTFELIFCHGQYVAGVHEAESQKSAEKLGLMLKRRLDEASE